MHYWTPDGRQILDGRKAGLWCVNAGHAARRLPKPPRSSLETMDFAPSPHDGPSGRRSSSPNAVKSDRACRARPRVLHELGLEAVDTALKIALAYHRLKGESQRTKIISRERAYHGVNSGIVARWGTGRTANSGRPILMQAVDYIPHTHDLKRNAFTRGEPEHGVELATSREARAVSRSVDDRGRVHRADRGSTGVLIPPKGYLKRIREICTKHNIPLIFDEVITGFGRTGSPFAAQEFGVTPDMITGAKGLPTAACRWAVWIVSKTIFDQFMRAPDGIELFHGYTYSGHPVACRWPGDAGYL